MEDRIVATVRRGLESMLVVFVTLKCTNLIGWSWWLVLAPALVPMAFTAVAFYLLQLAKLRAGGEGGNG